MIWSCFLRPIYMSYSFMISLDSLFFLLLTKRHTHSALFTTSHYTCLILLWSLLTLSFFLLLTKRHTQFIISYIVIGNLDLRLWSYCPQLMRKAACGFVGLQNLGATCYMNSVLQQIFMVPEFRYDVSCCQLLYVSASSDIDKLLWNYDTWTLQIQILTCLL